MQLFIGHIVSCLHLLKERIFFLHVSPHLNFFKFGLCVFIFSHLLKFPQNCFSQHLFCVSYFYRGRKVFFPLLFMLGGVVALHRGSCLYFIQSLIVLCSLNSLFSLILYCVCLLFIGLSLSIHDKKGERDLDENLWESCLFCLWGVEIDF